MQRTCPGSRQLLSVRGSPHGRWRTVSVHQALRHGVGHGCIQLLHRHSKRLVKTRNAEPVDGPSIGCRIDERAAKGSH
jgi:hypothetical protein